MTKGYKNVWRANFSVLKSKKIATTDCITLREDIFGQEIFAESIFVILPQNREIKFRQNHEEWFNRENTFRENLFPWKILIQFILPVILDG